MPQQIGYGSKGSNHRKIANLVKSQISNTKHPLGHLVLHGLHNFFSKLDGKTGSGYSSKKLIKMSGEGVKTKEDLQALINKHRNTKVSAQQLFGKNWKTVGKQIISHIEQIKDKEGGRKHKHKHKNPLEAIGKLTKKVVGKKKLKKFEHSLDVGYKKAKKVRDKGFHKAKKFLEGKTKVKPSDVLSYMANGIGLAAVATAAIPGVDLITDSAAAVLVPGLKYSSAIAKQSGRGEAHEGSGKVSSMISHHMPTKIKNFIKSHPKEAKLIKNHLKGKGMSGDGGEAHEGSGKKTKAALAALGIASSVGANALYNWYLKDVDNDKVPWIHTNKYKVDKAVHDTLGTIQKKGRGKKVSAKAKQFIKNHPKVAKKIFNAVKKIHNKFKGDGMSGSGLKSKLKKYWNENKNSIVKTAGVAGTTGALWFAGYLMNQNPPNFDIPFESNYDYDVAGMNDDIMEDVGVSKFMTTGSGIKVPAKIKNFVKKNPTIAKKIVSKMSGKGMCGGGKIKTALAAIGATGIAGAAGFAKYISDDPRRINAIKQLGKFMVMTSKVPMEAQRGKGKVKIKGSRDEVFKGGAMKTAGGLKKCDLMVNGRGKVVSKKRHALGLRMAGNISKYKFAKKNK